jgi:hypothetical protein
MPDSVRVSRSVGIFILDEFARYDLAKAKVHKLEIQLQEAKRQAAYYKVHGDSLQLEYQYVVHLVDMAQEQLSEARVEHARQQAIIKRLRWHKALLIAGSASLILLNILL